MAKRKQPEKILTPGRCIALASTIFLVIGAFMPWGYTEVASVNGLTGDGKITLIIGVLAFLLLFIKRVPTWVSLILGAMAFTVGIVSMVSLHHLVGPINGKIGTGLYLTILTGLGMVIGTFFEIIEEAKKMHLYYVDQK